MSWSRKTNFVCLSCGNTRTIVKKGLVLLPSHYMSRQPFGSSAIRKGSSRVIEINYSMAGSTAKIIQQEISISYCQKEIA